MASYYSQHRKERLEYQKQYQRERKAEGINTELRKNELSQYNKEYYRKNVDRLTKERRTNIISKNIRKLGEQVNELTDLVENILNRHPVVSNYYKITRRNRTRKNKPTIDTISIEFD